MQPNSTDNPRRYTNDSRDDSDYFWPSNRRHSDEDEDYDRNNYGATGAICDDLDPTTASASASSSTVTGMSGCVTLTALALLLTAVALWTVRDVVQGNRRVPEGGGEEEEVLAAEAVEQGLVCVIVWALAYAVGFLGVPRIVSDGDLRGASGEPVGVDDEEAGTRDEEEEGSRRSSGSRSHKSWWTMSKKQRLMIKKQKLLRSLGGGSQSMGEHGRLVLGVAYTSVTVVLALLTLVVAVWAYVTDPASVAGPGGDGGGRGGVPDSEDQISEPPHISAGAGVILAGAFMCVSLVLFGLSLRRLWGVTSVGEEDEGGEEEEEEEGGRAAEEGGGGEGRDFYEGETGHEVLRPALTPSDILRNGTVGGGDSSGGYQTFGAEAGEG